MHPRPVLALALAGLLALTAAFAPVAPLASAAFAQEAPAAADTEFTDFLTANHGAVGERVSGIVFEEPGSSRPDRRELHAKILPVTTTTLRTHGFPQGLAYTLTPEAERDAWLKHVLTLAHDRWPDAVEIRLWVSETSRSSSLSTSDCVDQTYDARRFEWITITTHQSARYTAPQAGAQGAPPPVGTNMTGFFATKSCSVKYWDRLP